MNNTVETPASIREFWFGRLQDNAAIAAAQAKLWWSKDSATDQAMRERFAQSVDLAARGELEAWLQTPEDNLSLILLCDQFPRNIYRDTPQAFGLDARARDYCEAALRQGHDSRLRLIERVFVLLPLEHSEVLVDQDRSVALFEGLAREASSEQKSLFDGYVKFAIKHRDIVSRFGRFPHRNRILGRVSSSDEQEFLSQPGSSF